MVTDSSKQKDEQIQGMDEILGLKEQEIATLKKEIVALDNRLQTGKGSSDIETKLAQAQRMLEKSNRLYVEMQAKAAQSESRVRELEVQIHQLTTTAEPSFQIELPMGSIMLCANGRYYRGRTNGKVQQFVCAEKMRTTETYVQTELFAEPEKDEYLKQLLLQFFRGDDRLRAQMAPIILGFLGVSDTEVRAIVSGDRARARFTLFGLG
jgi:hypothetical protein